MNKIIMIEGSFDKIQNFFYAFECEFLGFSP